MEKNDQKTCPEFKRFGFLYLSGELSPENQKDYKKHVSTCDICPEELASAKEIWANVASLPHAIPSDHVKKSIMSLACRNKKKSSISETLNRWIDEILPRRGWVWGLSTAAAVLLVMFILIRPFNIFRSDGEGAVSEELLTWDDDFLSEADWLESELDRVESGSLLASYTTQEEETTESMEWLSPMSEDIDWIRGQVEDLVKSIYGI